MKRKIISALVLSAIVLSMAGCGGSKQIPVPNESDSEISEPLFTDGGSTASVPDPGSTAAEDTSATSAPVAEPPVESKHITDSDVKLSNGFLTFIQDDTGYIYNIAEKKMYEYDKEFGRYMKIKGKIACFDNTVYNIETKEIIASSDYDSDTVVIKNGNNKFSWEDSRYIPIMKITKSVSGNTVAIGFLDENGEWVLPLSADSAFNQTEWVKNTTSLSAAINVGDNDLPYIFKIGDNAVYAYYNMKTGEFLDDNYWNEIYSKTGSDCYVAGNDERLLMANKSMYYDGSGFVVYDVETGKVTPLDNEYTYTLIFNGKRKYGYYFETEKKDHFMILDKDFNKLDFNIDYNTYKPSNILDVTSDYIVFYSNGFLCALKKDGTAAFEPFESKDTEKILIGDYLVLIGSYSFDPTMIIDLRTGEKKTYDNGYIEDADIDSGMLLINKDGEYYLAAPSDPETLINPFDAAR